MAEFGTEFAGAKLLRAVNAARAGGMGDNIVKNFLKEGASKYVNFLGNATIAGGLGFTAEGFTELGTSAGQMLTDKYVYDNDVDFMRDWRQLTDAFIIGGLMGGPVTSVSDFSNRVQQSNNKDFVYNLSLIHI